ncbi:hypothetical protein [Larkinella rosea]|nr:hypothetical protein [Larkinella rosea]
MKPLNTSNRWTIRFGTLRIDKYGTKGLKYRIEHYYHSLGVVTVYDEKNYCKIDTCHNGIWFMETRNDNPTDRQIAHFCRKLLLKAQSN